MNREEKVLDFLDQISASKRRGGRHLVTNSPSVEPKNAFQPIQAPKSSLNPTKQEKKNKKEIGLRHVVAFSVTVAR